VSCDHDVEGLGEHYRIVVAELERVSARADRLAATMHAVAGETWQIEQVLGRALGYPEYGPDMFPDGKPDGSVCVGECTPLDLAIEAANRLKGTDDGRA
jgi:hypothetical protein